MYQISSRGQLSVNSVPVDVIYGDGCMPFRSFAGTRGVRGEENFVELFVQSQENGHFPVLVLEGGADIAPIIYGEDNTHSHVFSNHPSDRDQREMEAIRAADRCTVPIFGICRGHQLLAAFRGGSLWQDIYTQLDAWDHERDHRIRVEGVLAAMQGRQSTVWYVNSLHHQAVNRVPESAEVVARTINDDIIEALWYPAISGRAPAFSTQWHPEISDDVSLFVNIISKFQEELAAR